MKTKEKWIVRSLAGIMVMSIVMWGCSKAADSSAPDETNSVLKETVLQGQYEPYRLEAVVSCIDTFPYEDLSEGEIQALLKMREEELLAQDVYTYAAGLYKPPIFGNIAGSESQHTYMVKLLLDKYEIPDPGTDHQQGVFVDQELQEAYDQLTGLADDGLIEALTAGATIEDMDIFDLQQLLENVIDNQDITWVFDNLHRGSRNHLRSFYGNLVFRGATYTPQYISQEYFDEIVNSPHEQGFGGCGCLSSN
jgi:hypothetical protein